MRVTHAVFFYWEGCWRKSCSPPSVSVPSASAMKLQLAPHCSQLLWCRTNIPFKVTAPCGSGGGIGSGAGATVSAAAASQAPTLLRVAGATCCAPTRAMRFHAMLPAYNVPGAQGKHGTSERVLLLHFRRCIRFTFFAVRSLANANSPQVLKVARERPRGRFTVPDKTATRTAPDGKRLHVTTRARPRSCFIQRTRAVSRHFGNWFLGLQHRVRDILGPAIGP